MFDHDDCTALEKERFGQLCKYETAVLSLLQQANSNQAFEGSDDEKQSQAKTGTMDEELSEAQSQKMEEEEDPNKTVSPYPALRSDKNFTHRMFGVSNIGNTCFFNATMQCLNASRPFVQHYVLSQEEYSRYKEALGSRI